MNIQSHFKIYSVDFVDSLEEISALTDKPETFFVIDKKVYELYRKEFSFVPINRLFLIDAAETKKNIDTVLDVCERMTSMPAKRNTHLVSIGGGIIQDITGFVASCLYRGIKWTFYPSTLLAACDSCIGGKSSLNYKGFKNLLGSFYPPDEIKIYQNFFRTLTPRDYCSGLGEVVKFNVIAGKDGISKIEKDIDGIIAHDFTKLLVYIKKSLEFKKEFIEEDEFDNGKRVLLNFAHTFGHAYETVSNYAIPHGSAVALGMITANNISLQRCFITPDYAARIEYVCKKILKNITINKQWFKIDDIIAAIHKDKKQTNTSITAVLLQNDNSLAIFNDVQVGEIEQAVERTVQGIMDA
jgi:3-dehydroquinate synthase